jgi:hypothetical protein
MSKRLQSGQKAMEKLLRYDCDKIAQYLMSDCVDIVLLLHSGCVTLLQRLRNAFVAFANLLRTGALRLRSDCAGITHRSRYTNAAIAI